MRRALWPASGLSYQRPYRVNALDRPQAPGGNLRFPWLRRTCGGGHSAARTGQETGPQVLSDQIKDDATDFVACQARHHRGLKGLAVRLGRRKGPAVMGKRGRKAIVGVVHCVLWAVPGGLAVLRMLYLVRGA